MGIKTLAGRQLAIPLLFTQRHVPSASGDINLLDPMASVVAVGGQVGVVEHGDDGHGEVDLEAVDDGHADGAEDGEDQPPPEPGG